MDDFFDNETKYFKKGILFGIFMGALIASIVFSGMYLYTNRKGTVKKTSDSAASATTLKKIQNIESILNNNYYTYSEDVSLDNLEEGIYSGMMKSIGDPYAEYFSASNLEELYNDTQGVHYGIGCSVSINDDGFPEIISIIDDSPAQGADVLPGDLIVEVEGESTFGLTLSRVVGMIKGKDGTPVEITFYREGETEYLVKTIIRGEAIQDTNVSWGTYKEDERIGYIFIKEFDEASTEQFVEAIEKLNEEKIEGLIIDLRGNPGGNLSSVVEICRYILPKGLIVYEEDRNGERKEYTCDGENELKIPLAVLINEYSASASEIMAGAIKDYKKGTLIGENTYGKGIVQTVTSLGDGSAIKYTKSAYFTPLGNSVQGVGIAPDIELELDTEKYTEEGIDNQFDKAVEVLLKEMGE